MMAVYDEDTRPNILLIMPDQMRGDCLSLAGHPALLTPNMDEIGAQGAYFSSAYTTCASCIPARRSLLTGQFPATQGMVGYKEGYPIEGKTLTQHLRDHGYVTNLAGRYMHQSPYDDPYGFDHRVLGSVYIEDDAYARMLEHRLPHLGGIHGLGISSNGWQARAWPAEDFLHPTHWTVTQARRMIDHHPDDTPLFMVTSFYSPHPPLIPPRFYMDRYLRMDLPDPAIGSWASPPPHEGLGAGVDAHRTVLEGEALRSAQAGYFGLINHIDDQITWLLREFQAKSRKMHRPWLILVTSDHGEMLGDHYYFRKCQPYEGASHIPLLIRGSDELGLQPGVRCERPVALEDLMPTLLDLAGVEIPADVDGVSLAPTLRGESQEVRPYLHGEHAPCYSEAQAYHFLTDGEMKYVWRPADGAEQLFDLVRDPQERIDLAEREAREAELARWRGRLIEVLHDRPERFVEGEALVAGRRYKPVLPHLESQTR